MSEEEKEGTKTISVLSPRDIKARMDAVEKLMSLFKLERMVYISATAISVIILLANTVVALLKKESGAAELTLLFGSAGLITITVGRLLYMWNQAIRIIVGEIKTSNHE